MLRRSIALVAAAVLAATISPAPAGAAKPKPVKRFKFAKPAS